MYSCTAFTVTLAFNRKVGVEFMHILYLLNGIAWDVVVPWLSVAMVRMQMHVVNNIMIILKRIHELIA